MLIIYIIIHTRWKKIACAFGNVRANLKSMATEQCRTFLQGKGLGKVSWHGVYELKGTFMYQDDNKILMKKSLIDPLCKG